MAAASSSPSGSSSYPTSPSRGGEGDRLAQKLKKATNPLAPLDPPGMSILKLITVDKECTPLSVRLLRVHLTCAEGTRL